MATRLLNHLVSHNIIKGFIIHVVCPYKSLNKTDITSATLYKHISLKNPHINNSHWKSFYLQLNYTATSIINDSPTHVVKMNTGDFYSSGGDYAQTALLASQREKPNVKIEAKISLQKKLSQEELTKLIQNVYRNNMKTYFDQRKNLLIFSGIPPDVRYTAQSILAQVKKFDSGARFDA